MEPIDNTDVLLPTYTDHDGFRMPGGFPIEGYVSGLEYQAQENDLFVAAYPKCGTTWCQHIVYLILNHGMPLTKDQRLSEIFSFLEKQGASNVTKKAVVLGGRRLIKTHLSYEKAPTNNPSAKYIFVARNPKDCVVSFYHHTRGFVDYYNFSEGSFDAYFNLFLKGEVDFGDYFACLRSWMDHRDDPNVLFLAYEEMSKNPRKIILDMALFLGPEWRARVEKGNLLEQIVKHSSIHNMREDPQRWAATKRPEKHTPFIRTGLVGGWDELLLPDQADLLDKRMRESFTTKELDFLGAMY